MSDAFFRLLDADASGARQRFASDGAGIGPWAPDLLHGGPPSALLVRACERVALGGGGTATELVALRTSVEFLGPVPVGELEVSARVVRPGAAHHARRGLDHQQRAGCPARADLVARRPAAGVTDPDAGPATRARARRS